MTRKRQTEAFPPSSNLGNKMISSLTDRQKTTKRIYYNRRKPTTKKTKDELKNKLDEVQHQYDQEQHRFQRMKNRKNYLKQTARRQRNHRLITRGVAMESIFPAIKFLTEREFYELVEEISILPGMVALINKAVIQHEAHEILENE